MRNILFDRVRNVRAESVDVPDRIDIHPSRFSVVEDDRSAFTVQHQQPIHIEVVDAASQEVERH
eukprot:3934447-Rhodomonas_salina.2